MKKLLVSAAAILTIASGSLGLTLMSPLGVASAADSTTDAATIAASTSSAPTSPRGAHGIRLAVVLQALIDDATITQEQADALKGRLDAVRVVTEPGARPGRAGGQATAPATPAVVHELADNATPIGPVNAEVTITTTT